MSAGSWPDPGEFPKEAKTDWMVVYRQGKARSLKVARRWLTWDEAHELAGDIVAVNEALDNKADHFQAWYVGEDATSVIDEDAFYRRTGHNRDWSKAPRLPIKRGN